MSNIETAAELTLFGAGTALGGVGLATLGVVATSLTGGLLMAPLAALALIGSAEVVKDVKKSIDDAKSQNVAGLKGSEPMISMDDNAFLRKLKAHNRNASNNDFLANYGSGRNVMSVKM
jgi:hypothetical protein